MIAEIIYFLQGYIYGFSLAAPPGPMNALIASRSLNSFKEGFITGLGAMTADFIFMILTLMAFSLIKNLPLFPFYFIGSFYMLYLAIRIYTSKTEELNKVSSETLRKSSTFLTSLALGISNPYQILWWLTAGLSFMALFGIIAVAGLFSAILSWIILFPASIRMGYSLKRKLTIMIVKLFSFLTLLVFSIIILYNAFLEFFKL
jgi:threonine/homoserine/homoserine lactone efflux protein